MILKYLLVVLLFLKWSKCALILTTCEKSVEINQKILQTITDNFDYFNRKLETLIEENQKSLQRISNLEISSNKSEAKEEYFRNTLIEKNQKILQKISNLEISNNKSEAKEENLIKTENTKILLNISDSLDVLNKKLEAKEEYLSKVFEEFDESIKRSMKIPDDESVESFLIKQQLLLHQMTKEIMVRLERCSTVTTTKDDIYTEDSYSVEERKANISLEDVSIGDIYTEDSYSVEERKTNISSEDVSIGSIDCSDLLLSGVTKSGFYFIYPFKYNFTKPVKVYCDMKTDGGGWTVFLQRTNASNPVNFTKNWDSYKKGFGNEEEFWLGNEALHTMTSNRNYSLRLEAKASKGEEIWGVWNSIKVLSEKEKYKLVVTGHDEKSTSYDFFIYQTDNSFSTYDMDNDKDKFENCAKEYKGGWWYKECFYMKPNERYVVTGPNGIYFLTWSKKDYAKRFATLVQLKIRPRVEQ